MTEQKSVPGEIVWHDLTVPNADKVRDFYQAVVGWTAKSFDMGEYADYTMHASEPADAVAGVCHSRGVNAELPPAWLMYVRVADLDASVAACEQRGGQVVVKTRTTGQSRYCVIRDPAGAVLALLQD